MNHKVISGALGTIGLSLLASNASADSGQSAAYARDELIYGKTYADWSVVWRQWADSLPANKHPLFDTAPCNTGQSGPVFMLGGRFCAPDINDCDSLPAERVCEVPAGKAIYFPIVNSSCLDAEAKNGLCLKAGPSITEIRAQLATIINNTAELSVSLDNKPVNLNLKRDFRVQSQVYPSILPSGNLYEAFGETQIVAGNYLGVDDGIYVLLKPLKKGKHKLNFKGKFTDPFQFDLDFTYDLTVR